MRNAFAPILWARPCPIFGRPVRPRGRPHRLQPDTSPHALRIPDRSGHPALRDIPSRWLKVRLGRVRLSPSCPFRLLHTRLLSRPARHYPRFRIRPSSSERRGDFNPHDSRAAQRTICPLLTSASAVRTPCDALSSEVGTRSRPPGVSSVAFRAQLPNLRFASLMNMDFATSRPLVQRSRLISGFCPSTRTFAPRFLQTPPRGDSPCASLTLHLHQVGKRTFTSKPLNVPGTQRNRSRGSRGKGRQQGLKG